MNGLEIDLKHVSTDELNETNMGATAGARVRSSSREKRPTEKGLEFQIDLERRNFRSVSSAWRKHAADFERSLLEIDNIENIKARSDILDSAMHRVNEVYARLVRLLSEEDLRNFDHKFDEIDQTNYSLLRRASTRIKELRSDDLLETKSRSNRTSRSIRSFASKASTKASDRSRKLEMVSEAAALKTRLRFHDQEAIRKAELEKLQIQKEIAITEARMEAVAKVEQEENELSSGRDSLSLPVTPKISAEQKVAEYLHDHREPEARQLTEHTYPHTDDHQIEDFNTERHDDHIITHVNPAPIDVTGHSRNHTDNLYQPVNTLPVNNHWTQPVSRSFPHYTNPAQAPMIDVFSSLTEQISLGRLPPPEPGIFKGDPLEFPGWKAAFETLVERRGIPDQEKVHYLKRYLGGAAKESVDGYLLLASSHAFERAKSVLEKRYGDSFKVAGAFRDKLEAWPRVQSRDGNGLRKYADYLKQCMSAMTTIPSLSVLNDDRENHRMLKKLPDWLVTRWSSRVTKWKEVHGYFPPFSEFAEFIEREADMACDPITSLQSLRDDDVSNYPNNNKTSRFRGSSRRTAGARSFNAEICDEPQQRERRPGHKDIKDSKLEIKICLFCDRKHHEINDCFTFLKKSLTDKKDFLLKKGICYGCLKIGHRIRYCKFRLNCKVCSKLHPTSLHDPAMSPDVISAGEAKPMVSDQSTAIHHTSHHTSVMASGTGDGCRCSMIVPVWLSHQDKPNSEILVYALLDTQSDTSFVTSPAVNSLELTGVKTRLRLSTLSAVNQLIECEKFHGLQVRAHNSSQIVSLPPIFSRSAIPASRSHIPTPDVARNWPHLERIAQHLLPLHSCEIGILIGYNCARALMPREVIPPPDGCDSPYGLKTDLGWSIVGNVGTSHDSFIIDEVGTTHRLLTYEIPFDLKCNSVPIDDKHQMSERLLVSFPNRAKEVIDQSQLLQMMEIEFCENDSDATELSQYDKKFLSQMERTIQHEDGHYEIPLPMKDPEFIWPMNRTQADHRLRQMRSRFKRDPSYHKDYATSIDNLLQQGFAEEVSDCHNNDLDGKTWFIPHHGIYQASKPNKLRVVFDCSARYLGVALNDNLLTGPDLTNSLVGVLARFRKEPVAITCDVQAMFHQFRLPKENRNLFKFLWWKSGDVNTDPIVYRMTAHIFGATSSPGCANYGLRQLATDYEHEFGFAASNFIHRHFYVDDGLISVQNEDDASTLILNTVKLCEKGGLHLHKFLSNSSAVLKTINVDKPECLKTLGDGFETVLERILGVQWNIELVRWPISTNLLRHRKRLHGIENSCTEQKTAARNRKLLHGTENCGTERKAAARNRKLGHCAE